MKRTLKTVDTDMKLDEFGTSTENQDLSQSLLKRQRFKTEFSIKNNKLKDSEIEFYQLLYKIEQKKKLLKQRISQKKQSITYLNEQLQKKEQQVIIKQQQITLQEFKLKMLTKEMSQLLQYQSTPLQFKSQPPTKLKNKSLACNLLKQINEDKAFRFSIDQCMRDYNYEYQQLWEFLQLLNKEKQIIKFNILLQEQKLNLLEKNLQQLFKSQKLTKNSLLEHLYSQCTLQNSNGQALMQIIILFRDIIRKIKSLNENFDTTKLPKELDQFEKQYLIDKVQFQQLKKSTIILNENYSQKLKIKNLVQQITKKSPVKLDYLKKIIGQEAYQYIPILNQNPFREANLQKVISRPQRVKSLEQNRFHRRDFSIDSIY